MTTASLPSPAPRWIFVNRFYRPDEQATAQLLTDLAEALAARGRDVTVIASHPGKSEPVVETLAGVHIQRVKSRRRDNAGLTAKAFSFASFYFRAVAKLFRVARRGDTLVSLTDPPLLGVGVALVAKLRGTQLVHWAHDIYPELAIELAGQTWLRVLKPLRDIAWRRADRCVTLGSDMADVLLAAKVDPKRVSIIPNWSPVKLGASDTEAAKVLRSEWKLAGKFVVLYSGNFGRVHDLLPVLAAAESLRGESDLVFLLVGDGAQKAALIERVKQLGLPNVVFRPPQPRTQLAATLAIGDVHLVTLRSGCERLVFPSKIYGIAAAGRPLIFLGPPRCDVATQIESAGFGRAFATNDVTGTSVALRELANDPALRARYETAARAFAAKQVGVSAAADQWEMFLGGPTPFADRVEKPRTERVAV